MTLFVFLGAAFLGIWGLTALIFRSGSRRAGLAMLAATSALLFHGVHLAERDARALGFQSLADRTEARDAGIMDAAVWINRQAAVRAQREADLAQQQRQAHLANRQRLEAEAAAAGFSGVAAFERAKAVGFATKEAYDRHLAREAFLEVPRDQRAFVEAIAKTKQDYNDANNDIVRGGLRARRKQEICRILNRRAIRGWVGKIKLLTTNTEGHGVVAVDIDDGLTLKTWNNTFSDIVHKTLIPPTTETFKQLSELKVGDRVKFSGRFFANDVDCIHEASITLRGAMLDPEFIMRFSDFRVPQ